ncbi:hypothetical protein MSG28_003677 [Choristoneura fumiferana]|uniref:Uncharacterized protein n=1 Tax=Choristoneura fumiferana TaxID=7141 RepID=A0ACC0KGE1_CHOFU|nr:hypothetical protein MSG28_003677 [Choristoneura fumiferana]
MTLIMGNQSKNATPDNSDEESGDAFTDGDFGDSDEELHVERNDDSNTTLIPVNETVNAEIMEIVRGARNGFDEHDHAKVNGHKSSDSDLECRSNGELAMPDARRDSHGDQNPSIVGILGGQQDHAEQRLAARRAARAEAREIRMRELERQQREQEDHADKAYDMYAETVGRRAGPRISGLTPAALHSPRRASEDSADDSFNVKDLRHDLKEVEEKFRKAMILNAQLDNDKAALGYQLELLKDRIEELAAEHAQLQREHKEKCSAHERLKREHASLERELVAARDAVRARDAAAAGAGFAFVDAAPAPATNGLNNNDAPALPALALVTHQNEKLLNDAGEGTLDVRLQKLLSSKQSLEGEVRRLKLQLSEEQHNGVARAHDHDLETELEALRKSTAEAKARAARAEAEAALQAAAATRLAAQLSRVRAQHDARDEHEEQLKQERRRLQREVCTRSTPAARASWELRAQHDARRPRPAAQAGAPPPAARGLYTQHAGSPRQLGTARAARRAATTTSSSSRSAAACSERSVHAARRQPAPAGNCARSTTRGDHDQQLKQERRRLQREVCTRSTPAARASWELRAQHDARRPRPAAQAGAPPPAARGLYTQHAGSRASWELRAHTTRGDRPAAQAGAPPPAARGLYTQHAGSPRQLGTARAARRAATTTSSSSRSAAACSERSVHAARRQPAPAGNCARSTTRGDHDQQLKQERRRLQREVCTRSTPAARASWELRAQHDARRPRPAAQAGAPPPAARGSR